MSLTDQEKNIAREYALKGAEFMFVPTSELSNRVIIGSPETVGINSQLKILIMQKKPIRLETKMVLDYCANILDSNNKWLLDQGHIKVVPPQFEIEKGD